MQDSTGSLTIVFNGEIYNFRELQRELAGRGHAFRSQSDTEVILAAYREWGVECLQYLNGMFALAIHDAARRHILLARDRAGEKPLFYMTSRGSLRFASELKALLADPDFPRYISAEALDVYLAMGYVPGELCMVKGANKLPPAHALLFNLDDGTVHRWRYWRLPDPAPASVGLADDGRSLVEEFESLLQDAVRRQLQADVPVGVLLSGGVDSSLITAMAVRSSSQIKTFTVGFPGFGRLDEAQHARLIAERFRTEHFEIQAGEVTPDLLPLLARQYDEPMLDSSMIPTYLVSRLVRQYCTVAVGGDGGDELFGGYAHYDRLLWTNERIGWFPRAPRLALASLARTMLPTGFRGRNWLQAQSFDLKRDLPLVASVFDRAERRVLMRQAPAHPWPTVAETVWRARVPKVDDLLERVTRMDFETYLPDDILVKVDRASMLNSLEVRAPLLDYRIVEFAFGRVPSRLKATARERKILLKRLAAKVLPREFDQRRKQGFSIPLAAWLRKGRWRDFFHDVLLDQGCLFDREAVDRLLRGQERGRYNQERLFGLVLFELWRREYRMAL
jgi:asparagine synthase (glutamine-hydrolysing)